MFYATVFFVIVNYMDNSTLYCTSVNLFESLEKATAFCVITGKAIDHGYIPSQQGKRSHRNLYY